MPTLAEQPPLVFLPSTSRTNPQNGRRATTPFRRPHNALSRTLAALYHQPSLLNRIARVLLCMVFVHAVIGKLTGFAGVAGAIAAKGLPLAPVLLVAAMALMAVGSALLLLFLVPTTMLFHGDVADRMERIQLFKNLAIMGGLLLVVDQDSRG